MQPNLQMTAYNFANTALGSKYKTMLEQEIFLLSEDECQLVLKVLEQMKSSE